MRPHAASSRSRRNFLAAAGSTTLAGAIPAASSDPGQAPGGLVKDTPRKLKPNGADLGSVLADVEKLARDRRYESSFLTGRFRNLDEFLAHGRQKIFDALAPPPRAGAPTARSAGPPRLRRPRPREGRLLHDGRLPRPGLRPDPEGPEGPGPGHRRSPLARRHVPVRQGEGHRPGRQPPGHDRVPRAELRRPAHRHRAGPPRLRGHHHRRLHVRRAADDRSTPTSKFGWDRSKYTLEDVRTLNQQCRGEGRRRWSRR